jgi:hypothetical protein
MHILELGPQVYLHNLCCGKLGVVHITWKFEPVLNEEELGWHVLNSQTSVEWRRAELSWLEQSNKWVKMSWANMTWTIKPMLNEDKLSWPDLKSQTRVEWRWAEAELSWHDLNSLISVEWKRAELAWLEQSNQGWVKTSWVGMTWTFKPMLSEILLVGQVKYYKSHGIVHPSQTTIHQASSLLRRRHLFFIRAIYTSSLWKKIDVIN